MEFWLATQNQTICAMKTQKKPLKKSSQKAVKKAIQKPAAKKTARKTLAKKLGRITNPTSDEGKEFPGYPLYPASEDIMNRGKRVEGKLDDEVLTGQPVNMKLSKGGSEITDSEVVAGVEDELKPTAATESDVTEEDLEALGPED